MLIRKYFGREFFEIMSDVYGFGFCFWVFGEDGGSRSGNVGGNRSRSAGGC